MTSAKISEFESLAHRHLDALYTKAIAAEPEMSRVESLVQDTVLKAFDLFPMLRRTDDFQSWLLSLLDETIRNQRRPQHAA